jgi:LuxR family maltose regulon positive regulatory protein
VRGDLVQKLVSGINKNNKLTLVSAPAGYGKTTLVLELLKNIHLKHAWISLDEGDNDVSQFLSYIIAALKKSGVSIGIDTERIASDINLSSTQAPMTLIINDIVSFSEKIVLILDDFHLINSPQVYNAMKFLLERQPTNLHLIVITREDPHFQLAHMRVQGKIIEIRMKDLCFTTAETEHLLNKILELKLSDEAVKSIAFRTEGWAAGLQLAGLSLNGCQEQDVDEFIRLFSDTHKYIIDYLVEEVINRQTEDLRDFLCKTSILDRMNGSLCDSLTGRSDSKQLLRELEKANLFLIPLDSKREWYRYHHLFADSLRAELAKKEEQELQKKAALWFANNSFNQEAINYALKSGDKLLSLRMIEDNSELAFKNAQLSSLLKWMSSIPEDMIKNSEILSVRKAWALYITGRTSEAIEYMNSLGEDFYKKTTPHNKGLMLSLKALRARELGQNDSERLAEEALKFLESWDPISKISTMNTLGRSQESLGKAAEAVETFRKAYTEGLKLGFTFITTISLTYLGACLNSMAKRKEAIELYSSYIDGMTKEFGKPLPFVGLIYIGLAELYYESNELEEARGYMEKGMELCKSISYNWIQNIGILNARIGFALGDKETTIRNMEDALSTAQEDNINWSVVTISAVLIELLIRTGQDEKAWQYGKKLKTLIENGADEKFPGACLSYVRVLILKGSKEEAYKLLSNLEKEMIKRNKIRDLAAAYILYAELHYLNRDFEKLYYYIDKAVEIAKPQDYYRVFLEDTGVMNNIIKNFKEHNKPFFSKVAAYLESGGASLDASVTKPEAQGEKLSKREIEILRLIVKGMSNNEIAKTLYISINTTQWHISHIYSKLDVRSRTQAAIKAQELGIL